MGVQYSHQTVSNLPMLSRWLVAGLLAWSALAAGQVTGRFYLSKETYAPGEPVYLYFEVTNSASEPHSVLQADPYSFCSGYEIHVSGDAAYDPNDSCGAFAFAGSCVSGSWLLKPGERRTERILLNYDHSIDAPGDYQVDASRSLPYGTGSGGFFTEPHDILQVEEHFHFRIDPNNRPDPEIWQGLVAQLRSQDSLDRREAARALATLAPRSLEDVLLGFADNPEFRWLAPLAFHRLHTERSMAAMAALLVKAEPGSYEHMKSADYLAESGDSKWFPLLLEVGREKPQIGGYLTDAAESGGDQALPFLMDLLHSPDTEFTRPNAVSALGYTGSRAAVPILVDLLGSPDLGTAQRALAGLRQLTHRSVGDRSWEEHPQSQHSRWLQWWAREGASAHIYKANECGDVARLP